MLVLTHLRLDCVLAGSTKWFAIFKRLSHQQLYALAQGSAQCILEETGQKSTCRSFTLGEINYSMIFTKILQPSHKILTAIQRFPISEAWQSHMHSLELRLAFLPTHPNIGSGAARRGRSRFGRLCWLIIIMLSFAHRRRWRCHWRCPWRCSCKTPWWCSWRSIWRCHQWCVRSTNPGRCTGNHPHYGIQVIIIIHWWSLWNNVIC